MADQSGTGGVLMPDTDYRYQAQADSFIGVQTASNQAFAKLMTDAQAVASQLVQGMGVIHAQWLGGAAQMQPTMLANSIGQLNASSADSTLGFIKLGAALSNSASPPVPGYQNLGPEYPGQVVPKAAV